MLYKITGEVIEHSELLNGEIQLILEGEFISKNNKFCITNILEWQMGNNVITSILHSELSMEISSKLDQTIIGNYCKGTLSKDDETGDLHFDLFYNIDTKSSDNKVHCEIIVTGNEWSGFINISENQLS